MFDEIYENLTPTPLLDAEDKVIDALEPINKPFEGVEKDVEHAIDTVAEDIFPEGRDWTEGNHEWWEYLEYFRWIWNWIFVGTPWFFFSIVMIVLNLVMNILLNDWWASGNFLLIYNTFYLITQTIMSWPLIFEIPIYMSHLRMFRTFSLFWSVCYMAVYAFIIADWLF